MHSSRMRTARTSSHRGRGSASVHAGIHPQGVGLEIPQGVGLEIPQARLLNFPPPKYRPEDPQPDPQAPPWVWAWKLARHAGIHPTGDLQGMLGYHLQGMLGYHPSPVDRQTHVKT